MTSLKTKYTQYTIRVLKFLLIWVSFVHIGIAYKIKVHTLIMYIIIWMNILLFPVGKYTLFYRLSLPEGVDYGTSTLTHNIMIPEPGFRVYGLSHSPQNTQTRQIISETDRIKHPEIIENIFRDQRSEIVIILMSL